MDADVSVYYFRLRNQMLEMAIVLPDKNQWKIICHTDFPLQESTEQPLSS